MWLILAFTSAALLGFYDVFKKHALKANDVVAVLTLNTLFGSLIFLPFVLLSATGGLSADSLFFVPVCGWEVHKYVVLKAVIVLGSWLCGYFALKNLPLTIVGPINATRPVMVLLGAIFVFGERLNLYQWIGVLCAIFGFYLLSRSGKKEGIDFRHNRWIVLAVLASALGAVSALYDKFLLAPVESGGRGLNPMVVQSFFMFYQFLMMSVVMLVFASALPKQKLTWKCSIPLISIFLCAADFVYFYALSFPEALIAVVSMIRRGSVLVSFFVGALVFHEKNLRYKAIDLALVLLSMVFLWLGST
ncbi:MAG: DMT family transporter [Bacteroidaceae bacterium]|nr:DMT family transporter [Bacteroidaceae bacterium]